MKTPRFLLIGVPLIIAAAATAYFATHPRLLKAVPAKIEAPAPNAAFPTADTSTPGGHIRAIFEQLNLTDAQKMQIAQIRQTTTDRQQRRAGIMNVLTPDQRAKFQQLRAAFGAPPPVAPAP